MNMWKKKCCGTFIFSDPQVTVQSELTYLQSCLNAAININVQQDVTFDSNIVSNYFCIKQNVLKILFIVQ